VSRFQVAAVRRAAAARRTAAAAPRAAVARRVVGDLAQPTDFSAAWRAVRQAAVSQAPRDCRPPLGVDPTTATSSIGRGPDSRLLAALERPNHGGGGLRRSSVPLGTGTASPSLLYDAKDAPLWPVHPREGKTPLHIEAAVLDRLRVAARFSFRLRAGRGRPAQLRGGGLARLNSSLARKNKTPMVEATMLVQEPLRKPCAR
jgi:hypothetical protein